MTSREQLGWWTSRGEVQMFFYHVQEKWGSEGSYFRFEIEQAMREWIDRDHTLAEAEDLLSDHLQSQGLSSSSEGYGSDIDHTRTVKLNHRVNADLKEEFIKEAKRLDCDSYGVLLARALNAHRGGGRAQRIKDDVETLITGGTSSGTTDESDENTDSSAGEPGTTTVADESQARLDESVEASSGPSSGTTNESDENVAVEPRQVQRVAEELPDEFPAKLLDAKIKELVGERDAVVEAYREPVANYKNVVKHPHKEDYYKTKEWREQTTLWVDLNRELRAARLRRLIVFDAFENGNQHHHIGYKRVMEIFEDNLGAGPSHDYAYTLMDDAANQDGIKFGEYRGQKQLRVDVRAVSQEIIEDVLDEWDYLDPDELRVNGLVTSYTAGPTPSQEVGADD